MTVQPLRFSPAEDSLDAAALALMAALSAKVTHLRRRREASGRWTLAKAIAAAALALELGEGGAPEPALAAAGRAAAETYGLGRAALKTRSSEARALLAYGITSARRAALAAARPDERLDDIAADFLSISLRAAMERRAEALSGSRGGRPPAGAVIAEVKALIRQDRAGDPVARAQLVALSLHLRHWTDQILQRAAVRP